VVFRLELEDSAGEKAGVIDIGLELISCEKKDSNPVDDPNKVEKQEVDRLKEALAQREKSLEMTAQAMSDALKTSEEKDSGINELLRRLDDLSLELQEKDIALRASQNQTSFAEELKQKYESLEKVVIEKNSVIEAFREEGQHLAIKQSEMEKMTRKMKGILKNKELELESLKSTQPDVSTQESQKIIDELVVAKTDLTSAQLKVSSLEGEKLVLHDEITRLRENISAWHKYASMLEGRRLDNLDEIALKM
jgi:chromosome segregation ATPase